MKKSNKFIALILCVVLICCSSVVVYADNNETDRIPINPTTTTTTTTTTTKPTTTTTTTTKSTTTKPTTKPTTTKPTTKPTTTAPKVGNVYLSQTSYVYNGKVKNPTIYVKDSKGNTISKSYYTVSTPSGRKNVGKYTYKITFKGKYSGSKSLSFTIKPVATSIYSLTKGNKKFTVKWYYKTKQVIGYQLQYSKYSNFKNPTTKTISNNKTNSKTITTNKSKQKYYVRVRTYKVVNGTKYYSAWSKTKSVTTN